MKILSLLPSTLKAGLGFRQAGETDSQRIQLTMMLVLGVTVCAQNNNRANRGVFWIK